MKPSVELPALFAIAIAACAPTNAKTPSDEEAYRRRPYPAERAPDAFAIYEVDEAHDITSGMKDLPPGFEIFHERDGAKAGYVFANVEGETQAATLARLSQWSAALALPPGDKIPSARQRERECGRTSSSPPPCSMRTASWA